MTGCCSTILGGRWLMPLRVRRRYAQFGVGVVTPGKALFVDGETRALISPPRGWSVFSSADEYVRELLQMAQWLEQFSERMIGYCLFCVGHSSPWESYDHAGPVLEGLAAALGSRWTIYSTCGGHRERQTCDCGQRRQQT